MINFNLDDIHTGCRVGLIGDNILVQSNTGELMYTDINNIVGTVKEIFEFTSLMIEYLVVIDKSSLDSLHSPDGKKFIMDKEWVCSEQHVRKL